MATHFIRDLETLRLAFRPPRPAVLEKLKQPMTVGELASSLGEAPSRLYYHVNELERLGLIRVVDHRDRGNLREKVYQVIAPSIRVDPGVFQGDEGQELLHETVLTVLAAAGDGFRRAASRDRIPGSAAALMVHSYDELRLPPGALEELAGRMRNLIDEFRDRSRPDLPVAAQVTAIVVPVEGES